MYRGAALKQATVLGASGYIGSRLAERLRGTGWDVLTPSRDSPALYKAPLGVVYYCSGMTANFMLDEQATVFAHVGYLQKILRGADFKRIIYLSSCRLYDARAGQQCREDDALQLTPRSPRHLYDLSKALGENLCLNYSKGRGSVARLACVYDESAQAGGFLPDLLRRLRSEGSFVLDSASGFSRDYISLDDVLEGLIALGSLGIAGLTVNLSSGKNVTNGELVDLINSHGYSLSLARESEAAPAPVCVNERMREQLLVTPSTLQDWLSRYFHKLSGG